MDSLPPVTGAAVVTSIVMYPADVIRAICMSNPGTGPVQAVNGFVGTHGLKGFVQQGLGAEITRASFSRMIKFWLQPQVHQAVYGRPQGKGNPVSKGVAGALATIPEVITISPLENMKLAEQLDKDKRFNGMADTAKHLTKTRGVVGGLYCGYIGMQMRQCLWTGGFFLSLDVFKGAVGAGVSSPLAQDIISGFMAGAFGVALNCWTDVVRSVIQKDAIAATFTAPEARPSVVPHFNPAFFFGKTAELYAEKGIGGLYSGVGVKMVHLGGSGAILAVLVPRFKELYGCK